MEKLTKEDVRGPDEFIKTSSRLFHFIEKHLASVGIALGVFILVGLGYSAYEMWSRRQSAKAATAFFEVKKAREKIFSSFQEQAEEKRKKAEAKKDQKAIEDLAKAKPDFSPELVNAYKGFLEKFKGTPSGVMAAIELSGYLGEYEKHNEAKDALKMVPESAVRKGLLAGLFHVQAGRVEADLGQCQEAISHWQKPLGDSEQKPLHADLLLRMAVCYENLKDKDKALTTYDRVIREHAQTRAAETAKIYKRLLERAS